MGTGNVPILPIVSGVASLYAIISGQRRLTSRESRPGSSLSKKRKATERRLTTGGNLELTAPALLAGAGHRCPIWERMGFAAMRRVVNEFSGVPSSSTLMEVGGEPERLRGGQYRNRTKAWVPPPHERMSLAGLNSHGTSTDEVRYLVSTGVYEAWILRRLSSMTKGPWSLGRTVAGGKRNDGPTFLASANAPCLVAELIRPVACRHRVTIRSSVSPSVRRKLGSGDRMRRSLVVQSAKGT